MITFSIHHVMSESTCFGFKIIHCFYSSMKMSRSLYCAASMTLKNTSHQVVNCLFFHVQLSKSLLNFNKGMLVYFTNSYHLTSFVGKNKKQSKIIFPVLSWWKPAWIPRVITSKRWEVCMGEQNMIYYNICILEIPG